MKRCTPLSTSTFQTTPVPSSRPMKSSTRSFRPREAGRPRRRHVRCAQSDELNVRSHQTCTRATCLKHTPGGRDMLTETPIVPYIPVKDMARARKFYEEKVGLKPKQEYAGGVIYECGKGSWVFMYPTPNAGTSRASTAFWAVDDVAAEVSELKSRGVTFEEYDMPGLKTVNGIATGGGAKTAWFKDSEGNILAVSQRL